MKSLKKILKSVVIISAFAALLIGTVAYASLGDLTMYNSILEPMPYYSADGDDFQVVSVASNDYNNGNFVLKSHISAGVFSNSGGDKGNIVEDGDDKYLVGSKFHLKLPTFYQDATPGDWCMVTFRVRADESTVSNNNYMNIGVFDTYETYTQKKAVYLTIKDGKPTIRYAMQYANNTKWTDVTVGFVVPETRLGATNNVDNDALYVVCTSDNTNKLWNLDSVRVTFYDTPIKSLTDYAGQTVNFSTKVVNNTSDDITATLIMALYDDTNAINTPDSQNVYVPANTDVYYDWSLSIPEGVDENWKLCTYLWTDDGEIAAYCDEQIAGATLARNFDMETLDETSPSGLRNWDAEAGTCSLSNDSYGGNYSLLIPTKSEARQATGVYWDTIQFGDGNYKMTAMIKADAPGSATLFYKRYTSTNEWNKADIIVDTEWKEYTLEYRPTSVVPGQTYRYFPSTAKGICIQNTGSSNIYVDDVKIVKVEDIFE